MPAPHFFDSSAIVKRYVAEPGTDWVRSVMASPVVERYIARITGVEVIAALTRRARGKALALSAAKQAIDAFREDYRRAYLVINTTSAIIGQAMALSEKHGLRGYDAIQLATALEAQAQANESRRGHAKPGIQVILVASDEELLTAAKAEGFTVVNPEERV